MFKKYGENIVEKYTVKAFNGCDLVFPHSLHHPNHL